jgi:aquaporin Z
MADAVDYDYPYKRPYDHEETAKYAAEFVGTYFLVLTVGCNVLTGSMGAALSIGGILMTMIYAVGPVSGAHLNPAVTIAVLISTNTRNKANDSGPLALTTAAFYIIFQLLAGILAGWSYAFICGASFILAPVGRFHWLQAFYSEVIFTAALCYVVLNVATVKGEENQYFGVAIGWTVMAAALAIGSVSGCSLNPAVSVGSAAAVALQHGFGLVSNLGLYIGGPCIGALVSVVLFKAVRPGALA